MSDQPPTLPQVPIGTPLERTYDSLAGQDAVNAASLQRTAYEGQTAPSSNNPFRSDANPRMADPSSGNSSSVLPSSGGASSGITLDGHSAGVNVPSGGTGSGVSEGYTGRSGTGGASFGYGEGEPRTSSQGQTGQFGSNTSGRDVSQQARSTLDDLSNSISGQGSNIGGSNVTGQAKSAANELGDKAGLQGQSASAKADDLSGRAKSSVDNVATRLQNTDISGTASKLAQETKPTEKPDPEGFLNALAGAAISAPGAAVAALQGKLNQVGPEETRYGDQVAGAAGVVKAHAVNATHALVNALPDQHTKEADGTPRGAVGIAGSLASATANQVQLGASKAQPYLPGSAEEAKAQLAAAANKTSQLASQATQTAGQYVPASVSQSFGSIKASAPSSVGEAKQSGHETADQAKQSAHQTADHASRSAGETTNAIEGHGQGLAAQASQTLSNVKATVASYLPASLGGTSHGTAAQAQAPSAGDDAARPTSTSNSQPTASSDDAPTPSSLRSTPGEPTIGSGVSSSNYSGQNPSSTQPMGDIRSVLGGESTGYGKQASGLGADESGLPAPIGIVPVSGSSGIAGPGATSAGTGFATAFDRQTGGSGGRPNDV